MFYFGQSVGRARTLFLLRSSAAGRIFPRAGVVRAAIACAGELAGSRPGNAFHLPGGTGDLVLIRAHRRTIVVRSHNLLIVVENLVPIIKRLNKDGARREPRQALHHVFMKSE